VITKQIAVKKCVVRLSEEEREQLNRLIHMGTPLQPELTPDG